MDQEMLNQTRECFKNKLNILTLEDLANPRTIVGVAFAINKTLINLQKITTHELVPGRALLLKISWLENSKTTILNVYVPVNRAAQPQFWQTIENERCYLKLARPCFIVGDFNIIENAIDRAPLQLDNQIAADVLRNICLKWEI
jgi:exonuclease III